MAAQSGPLAGMDRVVERGMEAWEVSGLALAVVPGDSVLYMRGYGARRMGGEEPVDAHTNFAIASTSKAFTTAALALVVDQKRLDWDDRVIDHLPGFGVDDPYVSRELTIRDLVTHRAGLARLDNLWIASPFDRSEILGAVWSNVHDLARRMRLHLNRGTLEGTRLDLEHWHQAQFRAEWRRPGAGGTFVRFRLDTRGRITTAEVDGLPTFGGCAEAEVCVLRPNQYLHLPLAG